MAKEAAKATNGHINPLNLSDDDIQRIVDNVEQIKTKVERGPVSRFVSDGKLIIEMIRDYKSGKYQTIPWWAIGAAALALVYIFTPEDIIPDKVPILGKIDDVAVTGLCIALIETELNEYKEWRNSGSEV